MQHGFKEVSLSAFQDLLDDVVLGGRFVTIEIDEIYRNGMCWISA